MKTVSKYHEYSSLFSLCEELDELDDFDPTLFTLKLKLWSS